jgi:hypothetical protein
MLPLHALRPAETGGLADYTDLATAAEGLAARGADFLGLNPIHAGFWGDAGGFSPYTPSHRRRLSAFHLTDGERPRGSGPLIDYGAEIGARRLALERAFEAFTAGGPDPTFDAFRRRGGGAGAFLPAPGAFGPLRPLLEHWPEALQNPDAPRGRRPDAGASEAMPSTPGCNGARSGSLSQANARAGTRAWAWAFISTSPSARIPMAPRPGRIATVSPLAPPSARRPMRFPPMGNPGALRPSTPAR